MLPLRVLHYVYAVQQSYTCSEHMSVGTTATTIAAGGSFYSVAYTAAAVCAVWYSSSSLAAVTAIVLKVTVRQCVAAAAVAVSNTFQFLQFHRVCTADAALIAIIHYSSDVM
jgi:hypothetical protein